MASSGRGKEKDQDALSPRAARAQLEEQLGRMGITDLEATPLVIDDRDEGAQKKWLLAGKVLHHNVFHINTIISALRPAWGNPKELRFDRLQLWARVTNLPFNLRDKKWWLPIARQIDEMVKEVQFDHVGGFLRARVTVDVAQPLRRWILIESARRQCTDMYEVQYEQIPHFCFSCGGLGHSDLMCLTPGSRDANDSLPYGKGLRAPDEKKRSYSEGSTREQFSALASNADTRNSSNAAEKGVEVRSPLKKNNSNNKRKAGAVKQVYRRVDIPRLMIMPSAVGNDERPMVQREEPMRTVLEEITGGVEEEPNPKKKRPTPTSSEDPAAAVRELRNVVRQEGASLLFVMETKIPKERVEGLRNYLGFAGCYAVASEGLSGGIGLF
ncbi:hypothetical protein ACQ4PT_009734 [Festuca glaucescens]